MSNFAGSVSHDPPLVSLIVNTSVKLSGLSQMPFGKNDCTYVTLGSRAGVTLRIFANTKECSMFE